MSLPLKAIDRLWDRLSLTYGDQFTRQYAQFDLNAVKAMWSHELSGFAERLDCIAWALEHLPPRCPNLVEFKNLCRQAPAPEVPRLPEPKADPERVKRELAKLGHLVHEPHAKADGRDWARRIVAKHESGMRVASLTLRMAKEALRPV